MLLKKTHITSPSYGKLPLQPTQSTWTSDVDDVLAMAAEGPYGRIVLDQIRNENFLIWKVDLSLNEDLTLIITDEQPILQFIANLKSDFELTPEGIFGKAWRRLQFNVFYLPAVDCQCNLPKGEFQMFGVEFSVDYLNRWIDAFPLLNEFLQNFGGDAEVKIRPSNPSLSPRKMQIIHDIINAPYTGKQLKMFLEPKVLELLRLALESATGWSETQDDAGLPEPVVSQLLQVREHLFEHFTNPPSLPELAHMAGLNEFILKVGFKKLYGATIFDFITQLRMERANTLLMETRHSIKSIATMVGFKTVGGFSRRFKKFFGIAPKKIRA